MLDEDGSMVLLNRMGRLQVLCDFQKAEDVSWDEASPLIRCVMRHESRPIAKMEALKPIYLANKMTNIVCHNSSFVAVVIFVSSF